MRISYNWLSEYLEKPLPKPEELARVLTMHAFEVESAEAVDDDYIFEIDVLPNRTHDCLSYVGMAREVAVLTDNTLKLPQNKLQPDPDVKTADSVSLSVEDTNLVRRAMKRVVFDVKVGESPDWLKEKLVKMGQKPKNNIVDITNFVTFEMGQPVHAFDYDKIYPTNNSQQTTHNKKGIIIRKAREGEKITTLDGEEYELDEAMLVISDGGPSTGSEQGKALDIAGVKGGVNSGIDEKTTKVVLSACNFHPTNIRKTSRKLGLLTDASKRFEQEITPELAEVAIERLSALIAEVAGGRVSEDVVDIYPRKRAPYKIGVTADEANKLLGTILTDSDIEKILSKLNFEYEKVVPIEKILPMAEKLVGKPYKYGASISYDAPEEFDCSSFTAYLFAQAGIALPRITIDQFFFGEGVDEKSLKPGDLIFSQNGGINNTDDGKTALHYESKEFLPNQTISDPIDHLGMYLGKGKVIHASGYWHKGEVVVEDLDKTPSFKNIRGFRRVPGAEEERFVVTAPSERLDLMAAKSFLLSGTTADLIEEIGRVYGYENIESNVPEMDLKPKANKVFYYINKIRDILVGEGFSEVYTYVFQEKGEVEVANPIASDKKFLRDSLHQGLLKALELNGKNAPLFGGDEIKIFEIGTVFNNDEEIIELGLGRWKTGKAGNNKEIFDDVSNTLSRELGAKIKSYDAGGISLVNITELLESLSVPESFEDLEDIDTAEVAYRPISPYPFALRDIALWCPRQVKSGEVLKVIRENGGEWLVRADLFDEFIPSAGSGQGKEDRVSYAFHLVFQSQEKTLSDSEVNEVMNKIYKKLEGEGWENR